jgi:pimeloyl-ACP methyl ester carboxylesterase
MIEIKQPRPIDTLFEAFGLTELARLGLHAPRLAFMPRGNGEPVMVLPGFGADDSSTVLLRRYLDLLGHRSSGWRLGANRAQVPEYISALGDRVRALSAARSAPVALVGWSLGGYIAREVARDHPGAVRQVITMGSPVIGGPKYTAMSRLYPPPVLDAVDEEVSRRKRVPLQTPVTAIYSRTDGVVSWQACVDDENNPLIEHVEVRSTHLGLGFNPDVLGIVARRLAA